MITPVLLCGGAGTRLWPLSRKSFPKQFTTLLGEKTLFQAALHRLEGPAFNAPVIMTDAHFRFLVAEQLASIGISPSAVLLEPQGRNTAPAILAAALHISRKDPDALMLIAPSDHLIPDRHAFQATVAAGVAAAQDGQLVTFGITPTHAETGYGYLELGAPPAGAAHPPAAQPLLRFVEKPDKARAAEMLKAGTYLWNAGLFLFSARTLLTAFETHAPALLGAVRHAVERSWPDLDFLRLDPPSWAKAENVSIDYAIMERADNISVVPFDGTWSDLGSWNAVWRDSPQDAAGVALSGPATALDCHNTLLRSEDADLEIVGIGLRDIVAVAMPDAVLIAHADSTQEVKVALQALKAKKAPQAEQQRRDYRPWGWFESLATGSRFQVKRIVVHPQAALSLQSHHHRAEHWIVVEGTAEVTVDGHVQLVSENQSVYVPLGATHRLRNPGKLPMILIEVQTGSYLGEDDIIRYEDDYARG
jgi:mannose-1-phosphate guanylyltransferase/mannose-1-phosphate guanylyltransferase/mannose-6-phosphate isomerase